jgi:hypothetical protein
VLPWLAVLPWLWGPLLVLLLLGLLHLASLPLLPQLPPSPAVRGECNF